MTQAIEDIRDTHGRHMGRSIDDVCTFAEHHGLTLERALQLFDEHGNDRVKLDVAAAALKARLASH